MRNENVTPSGIPDSINPRNRGIAEQEQNGVTIPSVLAITLPTNNGFPSSAFLVLSAEKYVRIMPTTKTINVSSSKTFGTSNIKNRIDSVR